jgi:hypothetical protein
VSSYQKINDDMIDNQLLPNDLFGTSGADIGDVDGDEIHDLAVGAEDDDAGGPNTGAVWILFMNADGTVKNYRKITYLDFEEGDLDSNDNFGSAVAGMGYFDNDNIPDIAVGAKGTDEGANSAGAVWLIFLNSNGSVKSHIEISNATGGLETEALGTSDLFGRSVTSLGDMDGNGFTDIAVGASGDDDHTGAIWILYLKQDGTVDSTLKIGNTELGNNITPFSCFGTSITALGDIDGDENTDIAVGAPFDDDGGSGVGSNRGAVWILFLNSNGTVKSYQKISDTEGNFSGSLDDDDQLGRSVALLADIDDNGYSALAVGANLDDDSDSDESDVGAAWILFLKNDGTVSSFQKISDSQGNFTAEIDDGDQLATSLTALTDLNGDGIKELVVGATGDDNSNNQGAIWLLYLNGPMPVPVELAVFAADLEYQTVTLNWLTVTESNNYGFTIERQAAEDEGNTWQNIGFIEGNGTTTRSHRYQFVDNLDAAQLKNARVINYRLKQTDTDGTFSYSQVVTVTINLPKIYELLQNHPNPFNPDTEISFQIPESGHVKLTIFNLLGQRIQTLADSKYEAGYHNLKWHGKDSNGNDVSSGGYLYQIQAGDFTQVKKMGLMR